MASSEPSRRWFSSVRSIVSEKVGEFCHSLGVSKQEEAEKCGDETSAPTSEMAASGRKTDENLTMVENGRSLLQAECDASKEVFTLQQKLEQCKSRVELQESQIGKLVQEKKDAGDSLHAKDTHILALQTQTSSALSNLSSSEAHRSRLEEQVEFLSATAKIDARKIRDLEEHVAKQSKIIANLRSTENARKSDSTELEVARSNDLQRIHELEDDLAKVQEDFESAKYSLEQEKTKNRTLLISLADPGHQSHSGTDECFNRLCVEQRTLLKGLVQEEESFKLKVSSLEKAVSHLNEANAKLVKERDEVMNECAIAKAEAEIFKADFEEERRDREKAQGALDAYTNKKNYTAIFNEQTADLHKEIARLKEEINKHKIDMAKMTSNMKSKSQTSKEVVQTMKLKVEELSQEIDHYKKKAAKVPRLESDIENHKKVMKNMVSKLEQKTTELSQLQKECIKLKDQVSHGSSTQVALTNALERAKQSLASAKSELQELRRSNKKLENAMKKPVKVRKSSSQQSTATAGGESDESSFETLYDGELARNLQLNEENEYLKGKIEDLTMEIQEHKKLMHEITKYRFEVDQGAQTSVEKTPSDGQHSKSSSHHMETRSKKSAAGNASKKRHTAEHTSGDKGQDISKSDTAHTTSVTQDEPPPRPPRTFDNKTKREEERQIKKADMVHEALHDSLQSRQGTVMEVTNARDDNTEAAAIKGRSTFPVGKDGNPLRAGVKANDSNRDNATTIPKGENGRPLRAGGNASRHREDRTKEREHAILSEVPDIGPRKLELHRASSMEKECHSNLSSHKRRSSKEDSSFNVASKATSGDDSQSEHFYVAQSENTSHQLHPATLDQPKEKNISVSQPSRIGGNHSYPSNGSNKRRECLEGGEDSSPSMSSGITTGSRSQDFNPDSFSHTHSDYGNRGVHDNSHGTHKNYSYPNDQRSDSGGDYYRDRRDQKQNQYSGTNAARVREGNLADFDRGRKMQRQDQYDETESARMREGNMAGDFDRGMRMEQQDQYGGTDAARMQGNMANLSDFDRGRRMEQQNQYSGMDAARVREGGMANPADLYRGRREQQQWQHGGTDSTHIRKAEKINSGDGRSCRGLQQNWQGEAHGANLQDTEIPNPAGYRSSSDQQQYPYDAAAADIPEMVGANQDHYYVRNDQQQNRYRRSEDAFVQEFQGNSEQHSNRGHYSGKADEILANQESTGELASNDGSHITYPSWNSESNYESDGHGLNPDINKGYCESSEQQLPEDVMSVQTEGASSSDVKPHSAGRPVLPTEKAKFLSEQYHDSNPDEDIPVVAVDPNHLSQPLPIRQLSSSDDVPSTVAKKESDDDDEDFLHKGIDHDIKVIADEVENEVNRDPSLEITVNEKPYDPNLICPICGRKFRIGEIQKFRKHVDACV